MLTTLLCNQTEFQLYVDSCDTKDENLPFGLLHKWLICGTAAWTRYFHLYYTSRLSKTIVQVKHDDRPARLILNRRPPAPGWAWLRYEDDGNEFEADLVKVQLVAVTEG
jgi:hypothetical protein